MGVLVQAKNGDEHLWNIEISCSQWERSACTQSALISFFQVLGGKRIFKNFPLFPNMFPSSSKWVPIRFPICSPRVFPIAPHFNPMGFAQSPPLLTYIGGPKGEALHLSIESSILGSLHSFNFLLQWANQSGSLD
jgi:hypothetical protein